MQVAEAKKLGDIGECENEAEAKVRPNAEDIHLHAAGL
jgi:hypothetical protein